VTSPHVVTGLANDVSFVAVVTAVSSDGLESADSAQALAVPRFPYGPPPAPTVVPRTQSVMISSAPPPQPYVELDHAAYAVEQILADARRFDVVHAHDFTALGVGHRLAAARGVPLVYDSHELWSGRPRAGRPTPWQHGHELHVERRLGRDAAAVLTVGDGVADELRHRHGWEHVSVVRNTFPLQPAPTSLPAPTAALYAGRLAPYRELEVLAAASLLVDLPLEAMGPADQTWLAAFDPGRLAVGPARPVDVVDARLAAAGLALVTHSDRWANHRLALPNKLFHAVRAGVPVVATDVGELAAAVRAHGLGTLYRPGDPQDCARAVTEAVARYPELVAAVRRAAPELSWQADAAVLTGVYDRLAGRGSDSLRASAPPSEEDL
jgi:glycosyltransferase involved in cell wall biosynthesis